MKVEQFYDFLESNHFFCDKGIWYSSSSQKISYPAVGHNECFQLEDSSYWFRHRNEILLETIKRYSPNNLFFDLGGGNGFVTKAIEDANIPAVLVEPVKNGVQNAASRNVSTILCGTMNDLSGLNGQIDAIGTFDVIEHIADDAEFVRHVYDLLSPGGYFFITVPAYPFLWSNEDVKAGHYKRYTIRTITRLLMNCGFEIRFSSYFFSILVLPLFLFRTLPSKLGIRSSRSKETTQKEHDQGNGIVSNLLNAIWRLELKQLKRGKTIPWGTSCLIVVQKNENANTI